MRAAVEQKEERQVVVLHLLLQAVAGWARAEVHPLLQALPPLPLPPLPLLRQPLQAAALRQ